MISKYLLRFVIFSVFLGIIVFQTETSFAICDPAMVATGDYVDLGGVCVPTNQATGLTDDITPFDVFSNILNWMLVMIGIVSVIVFVVSGLQYLTSAGDEKQIETAKRNIKYGVIGLSVALVSYLIIEVIDYVIS